MDAPFFRPVWFLLMCSWSSRFSPVLFFPPLFCTFSSVFFRYLLITESRLDGLLMLLLFLTASIFLTDWSPTLWSLSPKFVPPLAFFSSEYFLFSFFSWGCCVQMNPLFLTPSRGQSFSVSLDLILSLLEFPHPQENPRQDDALPSGDFWTVVNFSSLHACPPFCTFPKNLQFTPFWLSSKSPRTGLFSALSSFSLRPTFYFACSFDLKLYCNMIPSFFSIVALSFYFTPPFTDLNLSYSPWCVSGLFSKHLPPPRCPEWLFPLAPQIAGPRVHFLSRIFCSLSTAWSCVEYFSLNFTPADGFLLLADFLLPLWFFFPPPPPGISATASSDCIRLPKEDVCSSKRPLAYHLLVDITDHTPCPFRLPWGFFRSVFAFFRCPFPFFAASFPTTFFPLPLLRAGVKTPCSSQFPIPPLYDLFPLSHTFASLALYDLSVLNDSPPIRLQESRLLVLSID